MIIADTHIGKKWAANVPLHRRGDREKLQCETFANILANCHEDLYHLGDLFDSWNVSNDDLMFVHHCVDEWSLNNRGCQANFIAGNHDLSRSGKISSFEILKELFASRENVHFHVRPDDEVNWLWDPDHNYRLVIPFSYQKSYAEMVKPFLGKHFKEVYVHADLQDVEALKQLDADHIYSGHLHNLRPHNVVGGVEFVNSMLPLNHYEAVGTQWDGTLYKTFDCVDQFYVSNEDVHDKCVKILVHENEIAPNREDIDAMQVIIKSADEEAAAMYEDVVADGFDARAVFDECMKDVDSEIKEECWEEYKNA